MVPSLAEHRQENSTSRQTTTPQAVCSHSLAPCCQQIVLCQEPWSLRLQCTWIRASTPAAHCHAWAAAGRAAKETALPAACGRRWWRQGWPSAAWWPLGCCSAQRWCCCWGCLEVHLLRPQTCLHANRHTSALAGYQKLEQRLWQTEGTSASDILPAEESGWHKPCQADISRGTSRPQTAVREQTRKKQLLPALQPQPLACSTTTLRQERTHI